MSEIQNSKNYDLEERTYEFASSCRKLIKAISRSTSNLEDGKQLARSSGSVSANYIEANESLSKKDFVMRIKICRKEAKESGLWLRLLDLDTSTPELKDNRKSLWQESVELMKIFSSIMRKSQ